MRIITILAISILMTTSLIGQSDLVLTEIMYNSPGEDLEFIEFYNNSDSPIDLNGYSIIEGVLYAFPDTILGPNGTFVVTGDSLRFNVVYGSFLTSPVAEWTGSLNNGGERIVVTDATLTEIIDITYNDVAPWPNLADGFGPSIFLCDPSSDMTLGDNWQANVASNPPFSPTFANPNEVIDTLDCANTAEFWLSNNMDNYYFEDSDTIEIAIYRQSNSMQTDTVVAALPGLLEEGIDYEVITDTLVYTTGQTGPEFFVFRILDDAIPEDYKIGFLEVAYLGDFPITFPIISTVHLIDNDGPLTNKIELRGVLENSDFKALEFFVKADLGIGELTNFTLGAANNGNGSDGTEHFIDNNFVAFGECFFIANDTVRFKKFMGFEDGEVNLLEIDNFNFNGNDAVELFEKGQLIDVFGFQNEDGEGTAWEYTDSWAKKIVAGNNTSFDLAHWNYGGVAAIDAEENTLATNPYPLECIPTSIEDLQLLSDILLYPNPTSGQLTVEAEENINSISIISVTGQTYYENYNLDSSIVSLDMSLAATGLYLIKFSSDNKIGVRRLIVE